MVGLIGDRLRRWLDGRSGLTEATLAAATERGREPTEMDDANAGPHRQQDRIPIPAGPAAAVTPSGSGGLAREANHED
jgi:hypothetical protein